MKHKCPKCGHRFDDGAQAKAAKARWKKTNKADRSSAASAAAKARWAKKLPTGTSNNRGQTMARETPEQGETQ